jgi:hypothetical protein
LFGFGGQNKGNCRFVDFLPGSLGEPAGELVIADGLRGRQKTQQGADLLRRQRINDFVKTVQIAHLRPPMEVNYRLQYIEGMQGRRPSWHATPRKIVRPEHRV